MGAKCIAPGPVCEVIRNRRDSSVSRQTRLDEGVQQVSNDSGQLKATPIRISVTVNSISRSLFRGLVIT